MGIVGIKGPKFATPCKGKSFTEETCQQRRKRRKRKRNTNHERVKNSQSREVKRPPRRSTSAEAFPFLVRETPGPAEFAFVWARQGVLLSRLGAMLGSSGIGRPVGNNMNIQKKKATRKTKKSSEIVIPDKLYFRIGEVARLCHLPAYVLRFWETEFPQLKPPPVGHR